jgi:hypothetical protein
MVQRLTTMPQEFTTMVQTHDDAANASSIEALHATTSSFTATRLSSIYETKTSCHQKGTRGTPDASAKFGRTIAG